MLQIWNIGVCIELLMILFFLPYNIYIKYTMLSNHVIRCRIKKKKTPCLSKQILKVPRNPMRLSGRAEQPVTRPILWCEETGR